VPIDPSKPVLEHPWIDQVEIPVSNASLVLKDAHLGIDVMQVWF
jgi:hypothetical protein